MTKRGQSQTLPATPGRPLGTTRRAVIGGGLSAGIAGLLSACGAGGQAGGAQSGGPKRASTYTVRVQVWGDIQDRDVYENIAAAKALLDGLVHREPARTPYGWRLARP